jgi:HPt (histidine-containing phosphotransfer) domain-containing protein
MDRVGDDEELLREIVLEYFGCRAKMMSGIRQAIASRDAEKLERAAHAFKGTVGTLGAKSVAEAALRLEAMGRSGNLAEAEEAYGKLEEEVARLQGELTQLAAAEGPK